MKAGQPAGQDPRNPDPMSASPTASPATSPVPSPAASPGDLPDLDDADLLARLNDSDPTVRRIAVLALAEEGDEANLPWLTHLLRRDPEAEVRREAAEGLAAREDEGSVTALVAALADIDAEVRETAAASLAEVQEPATAQWLLPALEALSLPADSSTADSTPAASPSSPASSPASSPGGETARHFRSAALLRALRGLRVADALEPARRLLSDAEPEVRREAVGVIGWLQAASALADLTRLAGSDGDASVRRAATGALGLSSDPQPVLPALRAALADSDWTVREEAAATLGKLRSAEAVTPLSRALVDDFWQVRLAAVRALGRLGTAAGPAVDVILLQLEQPAPNLRKETVIALGQIGDPRARPALEQAANDPDPDVRKLARLALQVVGPAADHRSQG